MRLLIAHVPYTNGLPEQLVSSLVWNGQPGVQIFFVVSGFLITATTLRRWGAISQVSLRGFYLMRFARIVPLLLLLLSVLSILHLAQVKYFVVSSKTGGLGRALIAALTFHVNVLEARRGYLPGSWDILWSLSHVCCFRPISILCSDRETNGRGASTIRRGRLCLRALGRRSSSILLRADESFNPRTLGRGRRPRTATRVTVVTRWDEEAGLRTGCCTLPSYRRAQGTDKKETDNEKG